MPRSLSSSKLISYTIADISLVPTLDLPLQTILTFQACPAPVATSYLQGLCSAEGYLVERDSLLELYDSTCECTDIPISSSALLEDFPVPDLRRTINCLQLRCSTTGGTIPPSGRTVKWQTESEYSIEDLSDWKWSIKGPSSPSVSSADAEFPSPCVSVISHVDLVSFVDSQLLQSELDRSEVRATAMRRCFLTLFNRNSTTLSPPLTMNVPYCCMESQLQEVDLNFDVGTLPRQSCDFHVEL